MPQELIQLNTRSIFIKLLLIALVIAAGMWSYFVVRWYVGNTLAEYFDPSVNNLQVAQMAASLAPNDPMTHWRLAQVTQKVLPLDKQMQSIPEYERAVTLSPNDYRFWMELGTASEQAGDLLKAEQALKRAVALAPAYAYPHWFLGNLYLRAARYDEAFAELRLASEADPDFQPQQFNLIWEVYNADVESLKKAAGENASTRAKFALYLLTRQQFDVGLKMWDTLNADEKRDDRETGHSMVNNLIAAYHFHDAVRVWNDITGVKNFRVETDHVLDGSFDGFTSYGAEMPFSWQVTPVIGVKIGIDPKNSHSGASSLRLVFQVRQNIEGINVSQLVPVTPKSEYDFEFYVATEKFETGGPTLVQVVDPTTSAVLVSSPAASNGTTDWTRVGLTFKTGDKTEAVMIKIVRPSCGTQEVPICPIFGSVWYDDFSIKRRG